MFRVAVPLLLGTVLALAACGDPSEMDTCYREGAEVCVEAGKPPLVCKDSHWRRGHADCACQEDGTVECDYKD